MMFDASVPMLCRDYVERWKSGHADLRKKARAMLPEVFAWMVELVLRFWCQVALCKSRYISMGCRRMQLTGRDSHNRRLAE